MNIDDQYGSWTIISRAQDRPTERKQSGADVRFWLCRCVCRTEKEVCERSLTRGKSLSCGCVKVPKQPSPKLIDLTGQQFENWTVKHRGKSNIYGTPYWMCICKCGTEREISGGSLKNGDSTSCGCLKVEKIVKSLAGVPSGSLHDLTECIFGKWKVLSLSHRKETKHGTLVFWNVKCECGTEKSVSGASLRNGRSQSCGCSFGKDITGQTFGRLTVISKEPERSKQGHIQWLCQCECGNTKIVPSVRLVRGTTASCGCAQKDGAVVRPESLRKDKAARIRKQYREDVSFNLNRRMSSMIRLALRRENTEKGGRWTDLVDYTVDDLRAHLEMTMPEGYTWQDYLDGLLHIDHIVPLIKFDYKSPSDLSFKQAWSLSNLQLLPALDNVTKNDRLNVSEAQMDLFEAFGLNDNQQMPIVV